MRCGVSGIGNNFRNVTFSLKAEVTEDSGWRQ